MMSEPYGQQRSPNTKNGQYTTSSMLTQIEKLRKLIKERDAENIRLKQDNLTLRQVSEAPKDE